MVHTSWNTYTRHAYFAHEQWTSYCLGRELALRFKYLSLGRHAYRGHASDPCWPDKFHLSKRPQYQDSWGSTRIMLTCFVINY